MNESVINQFQFQGEVFAVNPTGNGHINDTYLVQTTENRYILQRINTQIFTQPVALMDNVVHVCEHIRSKVVEAGGNQLREVLNVIPTVDGKHMFQDEKGQVWRAYLFIGETKSYDIVPSDDIFYTCAKKLGEFQKFLADFDASQLFEVIPNFHNTKKRLATFEEAVAKDQCDRVKEVEAEIAFVLARKEMAAQLVDLYEAGKLPLRVTHNDTKINNILVDEATEQGLCVIDLDTVMPGLAAYDFGDAIRTGATSGAEDEVDLRLVNFMPERFEVFTKGFMEAVGDHFENEEIHSLLVGAKVMTFEVGLRFLTDYIEGDQYFKIHRPQHNLDRARNQFKLVKDMEDQWETLEDLMKQYMK